MQNFYERRCERSDSRREAVKLQLRASARRAGVEAIVLADRRGRIIARSDKVKLADKIASFSPFLAKPRLWLGHFQVDGTTHSVAVSPFKLGRTTTYLCAVGADKRNIGGAFLQTAAGLRRIMTT